ncbi:hypothetical protein MBLNU459_g6353t1 [Dothideomycetes sp. NU459]
MSKSGMEFSVLTGFFHQSEAQTDAPSFDYAKHNFGLISRTYETDGESDPDGTKTQWERFAYYVNHLRRASAPGTDYKILYLGRHGQGFHNVAETYFGTAAWDAYWSKLEGGKVGDETLYWADAHLTEEGIGQALAVHAFWKQGLVSSKIPAPQRYYASPLHRCLATAFHTFNGLQLPEHEPFIPTVKELLRERIGEHTCDRRSNLTYIRAEFPAYTIEDGFSEDDQLWWADGRETDAAHVLRSRDLLEDVFSRDDSAFISFTSHSGSIAALLDAVGHREFGLPTGGVIPVLVKAVRT